MEISQSSASLSVVQAFWPVLITNNFIGCFETTVHAGKGPLGTPVSYSRYSICKIDSYHVFVLLQFPGHWASLLRLVQMAARSLQSQQKPSVATRQGTCPLLPVNLGQGLFLNRYTRHERKECMAQLSGGVVVTQDILPHICIPLTTTSKQYKTPW